MCDSDDNDLILEDIKALEAALNQTNPVLVKSEVNENVDHSLEHNQHKQLTSQTENNYCTSILTADTDEDALSPLPDDEGTISDSSSDDDDEIDLSDPESPLNLNKKIIKLLLKAQRKLRLLLDECRKRQELIDERIRQRTMCPIPRLLLTIVGMPYFKDKRYFPAPKNQDAKTKAKRGELQIVELSSPLRWTLRDRNMLWDAIYTNAKVLRAEELKKRTGADDQYMHPMDIEDPLSTDHDKNNKIISTEMIEHLKWLLRHLGSKRFDWMKIAAIDFNNRHSAAECQAMWNVFLHPDINKSKWKKQEDIKLKELAKKYKYQNWDVIAAKLGTKRSGYQCFIRFNSNFRSTISATCSAWSKEEDEKLIETVNVLRIGNVIPWGEVTKAFANRRKQQVYMRWIYSLDPNLKKGRFSKEEDKLLFQGVEKYGLNFTKIAICLMPHRTTAQLNDHYRTLMKGKQNFWTYTDDSKLVELFKKVGNNWSLIAKQFVNKTRVQLRHRYSAILRYLRRGFNLSSIPRGGQMIDSWTSQGMLAHGAERFNEMSKLIAKDQSHLSEVDIQLKNYFKGVYPVAAKRGRIKRSYTLEELQATTEKLYTLLRILNADIQIPENLDTQSNLTEKDKQLLVSLKEYSTTMANLETCSHPKLISEFREKMFGSVASQSDGEHFIPPLPFSGVFRKSKLVASKHIGINYSHDGQRYLLELDKVIETPESIVSAIGGWDQEMEFQKMLKKYIPETKKSSENTGIYIKSFEMMMTPLTIKSSTTTYVNYPSTSNISNIFNNEQPSTEEQIDKSNTSQEVRVVCRKLTKYYPERLIPPNYLTLLGFRGILLAKHTLERDDDKIVDQHRSKESSMTPEGQKALELFEERFIKLFKFPIEFSEVVPPLLHKDHISTSVLLDDTRNASFNSQTKRKRGSRNSDAGTERKSRTKRAKVFEGTSET